jgi:hypothetical protein
MVEKAEAATVSPPLFERRLRGLLVDHDTARIHTNDAIEKIYDAIADAFETPGISPAIDTFIGRLMLDTARDRTNGKPPRPIRGTERTVTMGEKSISVADITAEVFCRVYEIERSRMAHPDEARKNAAAAVVACPHPLSSVKVS